MLCSKPPSPSLPPSQPQGPRTKDLSPFVVDMLCNAPTSVLIWPPEGKTRHWDRFEYVCVGGGRAVQRTHLCAHLAARGREHGPGAGSVNMCGGKGNKTLG